MSRRDLLRRRLFDSRRLSAFHYLVLLLLKELSLTRLFRSLFLCAHPLPPLIFGLSKEARGDRCSRVDEMRGKLALELLLFVLVS